MIANPVNNAVLIESVEACDGVVYLTVSLGGGEHYDMWQSYKGLPNVIEYNGELFGKSCWNSDVGRGYYRNNIPVAMKVR